MKNIGKRVAVMLLPILALAFLAPLAVAFAEAPAHLLVPLLIGSTLAVTHPTMLDVAKRLDPNGNIDTLVEILNQTNEVLDDMVVLEGNLATGHRTSIRTGLPTPTWRKLYGGVQPGKSTSAQVTDTCGMLEAYAEVDKALADLNGNTAAFRLTEDQGHIEGMSQEHAQTLFYGNEGTEPEAFTGLSPRYNSLSAENALNIIDHGGNDSDLTSIWLVVWGPRTVHGIYPKGSKAGLAVTDKGQVTIENVDGAGGRMEAYRTHYRWDGGLTVRDWRYAVRIANIDVSALATATNCDELVLSMVRATERIPSFSAGRAAWYCNRTVREALRIGILEKTANNLTSETVAGKRVTMFDGIPVRRCDSIVSTETRVT